MRGAGKDLVNEKTINMAKILMKKYKKNISQFVFCYFLKISGPYKITSGPYKPNFRSNGPYKNAKTGLIKSAGGPYKQILLYLESD